ncbi:MAG: RsmE family RNA methyltransferase [Treponema sp.]|uniref:RsmE family RNA methyltransferase n=1 Tax=Treponema sp. TaxID=166 RepID=UPI00298E1316|nr:RsmE family RNA methyltransferase [Treponema sp.]MBR5933337.1 RsmE family RNA methyltransferase [Treponema sp.]
MNICLFREDEINKILDAKDERAIHLNRVLHKKTGDSFSAGIIGGPSGTAVITNTIERKNAKTGKPEFSYEFAFTPTGDGKPLFPLVMIIGFPRPIQLKRLLRDIAGLGVCEVHLTGTELGEKSYMQSTLVEKGAAYQMLLDGTVQAAGTHVPDLFLHQTLKDCLTEINKKYSEKINAVGLDNIRMKNSLQEWIDGIKVKGNKHDAVSEMDEPVIAAIGSERGWTDAERDMLEQNGFTLCSMGKRVLRTETAATVSASIILSSLGYLC